MIRSRNQNSILAVATLGVYLGLILAGATPSVLAQAATAKQFNVKDEVAKRDGLDNKPEGCDLLEDKVREKHSQFDFDEHDLLAYASGLIETLQAYSEAHGPVSGSKWDKALQQLRLAEGNEKPVLHDAEARKKIEDNPWLGLSGILPGTAFEFAITASSYDIVSTSTARHRDELEAHRIAIAYDATLDLYRCSSRNPVEKLILKDTDVAWADDQVILITHLPRGSLNSLVASNAK